MRFYKLLVILIMATLANFANAKETRGTVQGYSTSACDGVALTSEQRAKVFKSADSAHSQCIQIWRDLPSYGGGFTHVLMVPRDDPLSNWRHEFSKPTRTSTFVLYSYVALAYPVCKTDFEEEYKENVEGGKSIMGHPNVYYLSQKIPNDANCDVRLPWPDEHEVCVNNCRVVYSGRTGKNIYYSNPNFPTPGTCTHEAYYTKARRYNQVCMPDGGAGMPGAKEPPEAKPPVPAEPTHPQSQRDCKQGEYFGYVNSRPVCMGSGGPTGPNKNEKGACNSDSSGRVNDQGKLECTKRCETGQTYGVVNDKEICTSSSGLKSPTDGKTGEPDPLTEDKPLYGTPVRPSDSGSGSGGSGTGTTAPGTGTGASGSTTASTPSGTGTGTSASGATTGGDKTAECKGLTESECKAVCPAGYTCTMPDGKELKGDEGLGEGFGKVLTDASSDLINGSKFSGVNSNWFPKFTYQPVCNSWNYTFRGKSVSFDWCPWIEKIRALMSWVFYIFFIVYILNKLSSPNK